MRERIFNSIFLRVGVVIAAAFSLLLCNIARADLEFKKKVIENCEEAKKGLASLERSQQLALIEDLRLVLKLALNQIEAISPDLNPPKMGGIGAPLEDLKGMDMWRTFQPNRELKAKRCATELLAKLSPFSLETVPDMIRMAQDKTLPANFRQILDQTTFSIAIDAANDESFSILPSVVEDLIELLDGPTSLRAENILLELQKTSVPFLIDELTKPDPKHRDAVTATLFRIDHSGVIIGQGILKLLDSADDGLRKRAINMLAELKDIYSFSIPALIVRLNDLSPDIELAIVNTLDKILSQSTNIPKVSLDEKTFKTLMFAYENSVGESQLVLSKVISQFGPLIPDFQSNVIRELKDPRDELRASALGILGSISRPSSEVERAIFAAFSDKSTLVRLKAIEAASSLSCSSDVITALSKTLKNIQRETDESLKQRILIGIAQTTTRLKPGTLGSPLIPFLIQALPLEELKYNTKDKPDPVLKSRIDIPLNSGVSALISIGKDSIPALLKALQSKDARTRLAALFTLIKLDPTSASTYKFLIPLLKDSDQQIRKIAESSLQNAGKEVSSELKKQYKSGSPVTRDAAARLLIVHGEASKDIIRFAKESLRRLNCDQKSDLVNYSISPSKLQSLELANELVTCLADSGPSGEQAARSLVILSPISETARAALIDSFGKGTVGKRASIYILENALGLGFTIAEIVDLLTKQLSDEDKTIQFRIINIFSRLGAQASQALPQLIAFVNNNRDDQLLANEAVFAIISIDATAFDYTNFILSELKSTGHQWAEKLILKTSPAIAIPVLRKALEELSQSKKYRVIMLIGSFKENALSLLPEVLKYIDAADPELSYVSTVALLQIDPANPLALSALQREIKLETSQNLFNENFDKRLAPLLESLTTTSTSLVEKRFAKLLLEKIDKK